MMFPVFKIAFILYIHIHNKICRFRKIFNMVPVYKSGVKLKGNAVHYKFRYYKFKIFSRLF